jgi:hypothetical protein
LKTWIVEELFDALNPDGTRVPGRIAIGLPRIVDSSDDEARCEVVVEPLLTGSFETAGVGQLQALVAALQRVGWAVGSFLEDGGRLLERGTDEDMAIETILGPLLRD